MPPRPASSPSLPPGLIREEVAAAMECELASRSLADFVRQGWHIIEPATPMIWNWHLDAICEHLEAVTSGDILRLIINMPPRHMKSIAVSVAWPAWEWGPRNMPSTRFLFASYAQVLAIRDAVKTRRLILSNWYQARWGSRFKLAGDQNAKERFENDATGLRLATSVGGVGTGEGGDRVAVDDPHSTSEGESDAIRGATLDWWDQTMSTRLNDPKRGAFIVIMQRVHESDLTGHILAKESGYTHLCLPCEYEPGRRMTTWPGARVQDPRREPGELLWPARFGRVEVDRLKRDLGTYATAGQLQQRPAPEEGGIFKRGWFKRWVRPLPKFYRLIWSWDTAVSEKEGSAYTVGGLWGECEAGYYRLAEFRARVEYPELKAGVRACYASAPSMAVLVEDKSSGQQIVQELSRADLQPLGEAAPPRLPIIGIKVTAGDKQFRARAVSPLAEAGMVWIPESAPWVEAWIDEVCTFPNGTYADRVDEMSQALNWLKGDSSAFGKGDFS